MAARLGVPDRAEAYERIAPYAERRVVMGTGITHQVPAESMGDRARALDHAERAHALHRKLGLEYWSARSAELLADLRD
ncbi:hypothetical protein [Acrocarpospora catenulata]|uniref:hypothetical protein n=1 Tax=Acrocarpospora catenulata TaxID=2836182 RepID=UPI001BD965AA|nr:hypothetical protein [Acrocarpospora catenulata]